MLHRIRRGELPSTPVRAGLFALTSRAAPRIRRCRAFQTKCGQLPDDGRCTPQVLQTGRGTDVDLCHETGLAIFLPTRVSRVIVGSHSARVLGLRRRAASTPISNRLASPYGILSAGALRAYPAPVMPSQQSSHHQRNDGRTCANCRSRLLARPPSRSQSTLSPGQASPVDECSEKPQTYVADLISRSPGMGWAVIFWQDEETGLDRLTTRLQQQFRPAPSAFYGTLPGECSSHVWIPMSGDAQSRCSSGHTSYPTVINGVAAGWSHCHCPMRWPGSTFESNDASQRSLIDRLCGPSRHMPAILFLGGACVHTLPSAAAIRCIATSAIFRTGRHDTTITQPASCISLLWSKHRGT